jgi:hypothetical protein
METDDLKDMLAESRETAARLGGLDRTATAADPTVSVTVTVRVDGTVVRARLHDQWRTRLGPKELGTAVAEAIAEAQSQAARDWAESPGGELEPALDVSTAWATGEDPVEFARELMALLDEVEARLPDLATVAQQAVDREVRVTGPAGGITAIARQGVLAGLEENPQWMREAPRFRIEEELSAVLARALPGLGRQATTALRDVEPVGRLLGLLDDPAALFARLGLAASANADRRNDGPADADRPNADRERGAW